MDSKLRNILAALGAVAVTLSTPALAGDDGKSGMMMGQGGMGMMGGSSMMKGGMMMKVMHALDLDEEQVEKMTDIHKELAEHMAGTKVEMQQLRWQMGQEMHKDEPSPEEVGRIHDQISAKKKTILQEKVRTRNEMMGVLNEEQREKLKQMKKRMHKKHMGGGKGRHGSKHRD
ncbi:MAG: Spy/CpxP family protein refolding chaperone [Thiohalorhabdus sp.]|uniref:Spy/CpxP family protein refolding chaperone n=1 Tax=Thiohalorhabdus sp. TaxID=3094134 RepID=UPI003981084F